MKRLRRLFVDTGAWIALALTRDPLHARARATWEESLGAGVRLQTSVPVVLETFTFLDRNAARTVAHVDRPDLHKVSAVDAISFVLMTERRIRIAFAFDSHFAAAGFRMVGSRGQPLWSGYDVGLPLLPHG